MQLILLASSSGTCIVEGISCLQYSIWRCMCNQFVGFTKNTNIFCTKRSHLVIFLLPICTSLAHTIFSVILLQLKVHMLVNKNTHPLSNRSVRIPFRWPIAKLYEAWGCPWSAANLKKTIGDTNLWYTFNVNYTVRRMNG